MAPVSPAAAVYAPAAAAYPTVFYAGFWLRFIAFLIDSVLRGIAFVFLFIPLFIFSGAGAAIQHIVSGEDIGENIGPLIAGGFLLGLFGIVALVSWLYYALFESSTWQATPGKKLLGLYVTDMDGQPVSFGRASGRAIGKIVTGLIPFAIGYILAGITEKKQALHDIMAGCLVLRKG
jgi:uncharacterized RDD family membrane protein YckC